MKHNKKGYVIGIALLSMAFFIGKSMTQKSVHAQPDGVYETPAASLEPTEPVATDTPKPTNSPTPAPKKKTVSISFGKASYVVPYGGQKKITAKVKVSKGKKPALSYKSSNKKIAKVDKKGNVKGISVGTAILYAKAKDGSGAGAWCIIQVQKEKKGWHKVSAKRKYYVNKNGKRLTGYQKIKGNYYYFSKKTSYAVRNTWKYVKIKNHQYKVYFGKNGRQVGDVSKVLGKDARYRIYVSLQDNMVMIYARDGSRGYTIPVKAMICSVGMAGHATRTGTYSLRPSGRWHVLRYNSNGQYATRYSGPYMFHSVTYDRLGNHYSLQAKEYKQLGKAASHGCIRLQVEDAKWIYEHAYQCIATIQHKIDKGPFKKPKAKKIKKTARGYYDVTDKAVKENMGS